METVELQKLKFRRQYLITPKIIDCPFIYNQFELTSNCFLYAHIDLPVTQYTDNHVTLILLGDIFDYEFPNYGNSDILKDLIDPSFDNILTKSSKYTGRFVIVYQFQGVIRIFHDATAARKIYYGIFNNKTWISSLPNLLAGILGLEETKDASKLAFYYSQDFRRLNNSNVGNTTRYDEIFQVLPNHYLDFEIAAPVRFWPNKVLFTRNVDEVALECAQIIKGYMLAIHKRFKIMLPVTAGKDSRLLLAATRDFCHDVYYYINICNSLDEESTDVQIPRMLMSKLGLKFHVVNPNNSINEDFFRIYFENNPYASTDYLSIIYNYFIDYSHQINLPGNTAGAGLEFFKHQQKILTGDLLTRMYKLEKYDFAFKYFSKWVSESSELCLKYRINMINLTYWEERMPNWGSQIQMEKDIAQDDINPFNSRLFVSLILSVQSKYITPPLFTLYKKIIEKLWPEVLNLPINPSLLSTIKTVLTKLSLLDKIYKVTKH